MPFKLAPRLKTFDYRGPNRYFLTICVRDRQDLFITEAAVTPVSTQFLRTAEAESFAVIAYCFMPDHMHGLVEGTTDQADLRRVVRLFKQRSSFEWKKAHGTVLWQRSYFERVLRADENSLTVARYIIANPVRRGLVEAPEQYPFLGSGTLQILDLVESVQMANGGRRT